MRTDPLRVALRDPLPHAPPTWHMGAEYSAAVLPANIPRWHPRGTPLHKYVDPLPLVSSLPPSLISSLSPTPDSFLQHDFPFLNLRNQLVTEFSVSKLFFKRLYIFFSFFFSYPISTSKDLNSQVNRIHMHLVLKFSCFENQSILSQ